MSRQEFPVAVRKAALKRCEDERGVRRCENRDNATGWECRAVLHVGKFQFDHILPDGLGGKPILANAMVLCDSCHKEKTHKKDRPRMQKADNQRAYQDGTRAAPRQKIKSRGFPKTKKAPRPLTKILPRNPSMLNGARVRNV